MLNLASQAAALGAAVPPPSTPDFLKTAGIIGFLVFVVGLLIAWKGAGLVNKADKQKVSKSMETGANVSIGVVLIVVGLVGAAIPIIISIFGAFTNVSTG